LVLGDEQQLSDRAGADWMNRHFDRKVFEQISIQNFL
jgi:hypothetical protein